MIPALTTRPDQIKPLRQTILNLAVRGKLEEQDPADEPASELLNTITKTRKRLHSEKKIPKPKPLPPIDEMDLPFDVPPGWTWSMLGQLCYQVADGPHFSPQYVPPERGVPFLSTRNVRPDGFDLSSLKYVSQADYEEFCKRIKPERNDIIYTKGGTTGIAKVNDLDFEFSVWVHLAVLRIEKERLFPRYIELALNSPHCYVQSQEYTRGISNFDLGLTRMIKITVPLPPLAEQHRIVAKVDALMALCDRLEAALTTTDTTRARLLETLLHEALDPAESGEMEAAE
jgi:type I restriction enzyme S subunit